MHLLVSHNSLICMLKNQRQCQVKGGGGGGGGGRECGCVEACNDVENGFFG